ncbi:Dol-P-Man:Man(7)GlcNAc(2)-PP-Dol alpha-1,6-mannosyltransferase [Polyrhizophydium stewartii]|uniref:Mannosyltransferase n=1 Tax=Polyrhizophydium stewartii TaxID=2732419 RepID=A0ABR4NG25_9FUNG
MAQPKVKKAAAAPAARAPRRLGTRTWTLLLAAALLAHLFVAPYTKVEESFHVQAAHDLIFHGPLATARFDHREFPGPVRRSFLGAAALWLSTLPVTLPVLHFPALGLEPLVLPRTKMPFQLIVRGALALATAASLAAVQRAARRAHGRLVAAWFGLFSLAQFHMIFWGSRTLSNTFALVAFNVALAAWIDCMAETPAHRPPPAALTPKFKRVLAVTAFGAVALRAELALPAAIIALSETRDTHRFGFFAAIKYGLAASAATIAATVAVDSYFWGSLLVWPELESVFFNVVENHAAEWGTSPYHTYFTSLIPRIAPVTYIASFVAWRFANRAVHAYWRLMFAFVCIYSLLGHKEWRFVVYVVPVLNLIAAIGVARFHEMAAGLAPIPETTSAQKSKDNAKATDAPQPSGRRVHVLAPRTASVLLSIINIATLAIFVVSCNFLHISSLNYPGGHAFARLHNLVAERPNVPCSIHIDTFAAMSGVTRFGEHSAAFPVECAYSKNESHTSPADFIKAEYTYLLTSEPDKHLNASNHWRVLEAVKGFSGLRMLDLPDWQESSVEKLSSGRIFELTLPIVPVMSPQVYILGRASD